MSGDRGELKVPFDTTDNQTLAANPGWSIWVSANAGSGKTYVLTRRVLRLLLAGVTPESILCLTYTKAAAAEMRRRVAGALADWAVLDDAELDVELAKIEGAGLTPKNGSGRAPCLRGRSKPLAGSRSSPSTPFVNRCCTGFRSKRRCRSIFR